MKEIPLSQVLLVKTGLNDKDLVQLVKSKLTGLPVTGVIEGELMVYLKTKS